MDPLLVITNANAGPSAEQQLAKALDTLRRSADVQVEATADTAELGHLLATTDARRIVVAGGDGSLHAVVDALRRRGSLDRFVLGLLPLGTGNDFARGTGIPLNPVAAARVVLDGTVRGVDVLVGEDGGVVVNNVHVGAGAQASRLGRKWKRRLGRVGVRKLNLGKLGYPMGAVLAALRKPTVHLRVEVDGEVVARPHESLLMVAIGNGADVGGGTRLTPEAEVGDGHADVMISRSVGRWARWGYVARLSRGVHHQRADVTYLTGLEVRVSGARFWCAADGELTGPHRERSWRLDRGAFSMVLPAEGSGDPGIDPAALRATGS